MPLGMEGELWIGGVGVALGYLYAPDLTKEVVKHLLSFPLFSCPLLSSPLISFSSLPFPSLKAKYNTFILFYFILFLAFVCTEILHKSLWGRKSVQDRRHRNSNKGTLFLHLTNASITLFNLTLHFTLFGCFCS